MQLFRHEGAHFDKWLGGGQIPTVTLQHWLYHGQLHWFDYYLYFTYMLHFVAPFVFGLLLWRFRPSGYWRFITALVAVSYAGFITYLLFPAAPPWIASNVGYIDHITKISSAVWISWGIHSFPTLYAHLNPNETAAMPSLHAAIPFLELMYIKRLFGPKYAAVFAIYPLSLWFGVVYIGEHYVLDILVGLLYALVAFYGTEYLFAHFKSRRAPSKNSPQPLLDPVLD